MTRDQLIAETRRLIAEGERLQAQPSMPALRTWLQVSDALLSSAWGPMDRYHLTWLSVGRPKQFVHGRRLTEAEEAAYVQAVAKQKTAALRVSLDAVERQRMPFVGEEGGVGAGQGMGSLPAVGREADTAGRDRGDTAAPVADVDGSAAVDGTRNEVAPGREAGEAGTTDEVSSANGASRR